MPQQTAVEWLYKLSKERELDKFDLKQAKQMEKEQMKKMYNHAMLSLLDTGHGESFDDYYKRIYGE